MLYNHAINRGHIRSDEMAKKQWSEMSKGEKAGGIIVLIVIALIVIGVISSVAGGKNTNNTSTSNTANTTSNTSAKQTQQSTSAANQPATKVATRQVTGTATTLGAGSFTGGTDVPAGLYDVTTGPGQSGNFMVSGTDSYNEILDSSGQNGEPKIRVQISKGDQIQISGLSSVTFTPVTTPFITTHSLVNLYAGTWTVGQDIGAGRYVATPGSGQSGNFIVTGNDSYNEILDSTGSNGETSLTVNLTDGDVISISSMSQVTMTPSD